MADKVYVWVVPKTDFEQNPRGFIATRRKERPDVVLIPFSPVLEEKQPLIRYMTGQFPTGHFEELPRIEATVDNV